MQIVYYSSFSMFIRGSVQRLTILPTIGIILSVKTEISEGEQLLPSYQARPTNRM
jgi:hypothetical protein